MLDAMGGRKVVVALIIFITGMIVTAIKGDVPANLLQLLSIIYGSLVVGNIGEYAFGAFSSKAAAPAPGAVTKEELQAHMEEMRALISKQSEATATVQQALSMIITKYGV